MPEVSVIIPCYNHAHYLPDALNSVLAQTFVNWEAIIVDDGATDNTQQVAAQFTDPRIRYIYQENRGLSSARNTGIAAARGGLIALLDADDVWRPTFLRRMLDALDAHPEADAAYCGFQYMDAGGTPLRQSVCKVVPPERFFRELVENGSWLCPCSVVARSSAYRAAGPFDEDLRACEDLDMWWRISREHLFLGVPEVLVLYRRAGTNMSDNPDRMTRAFSMLIEKHLGPLSEPMASWSADKSRLACRLYEFGLQGYLAQGRVAESAASLAWLAKHHFDLVNSLDIWYALACVHQQIGQRGDFDTWQPERGEADVLTLLQEAIRNGVDGEQVRAWRGQAHLALASLNYGKGCIPAARCHLTRGLANAPTLVHDARVWRLAARLLPGASHLRGLSRGDRRH